MTPMQAGDIAHVTWSCSRSAARCGGRHRATPRLSRSRNLEIEIDRAFADLLVGIDAIIPARFAEVANKGASEGEARKLVVADVVDGVHTLIEDTVADVRWPLQRAMAAPKKALAL